ncbi:hypothetical protein D1007_43542 [Hordeum vulgare]|nr:hypothetical protein D1007_43542 [Hordeum vulgare]
MAVLTIPLHIHALLTGVLPPFLSFLVLVLSHYQIHALHIDPRSFVLLSAFAQRLLIRVGPDSARGAEAGGVTMAMVVREFICQRIAPLQRHSRPMWTFRGLGTQ